MEPTEAQPNRPFVNEGAQAPMFLSAAPGQPLGRGPGHACPAHRSPSVDGSIANRILLEIPLDVTRWVGEETLMGWIEEEIDTLDRADPKLFGPTKSFSVPGLPKALAFVIALACLRFTFGIPKIPPQYCSKPTQGHLPGGPMIFPEDLSRFRHLHRDALVMLLTRLLARVSARHYEFKAPLCPDCVRTLEALAIQRLNIAHQLETEDE